VRIGQIASRDQDSLAIQRGVARGRGRLLLLLLLYGGLAGRHTEERAEDRDDTGETMHTRLLFLRRFLHLRARLAAKMRHHLFGEQLHAVARLARIHPFVSTPSRAPSVRTGRKRSTLSGRWSPGRSVRTTGPPNKRHRTGINSVGASI
jgi:hypothetical protein